MKLIAPARNAKRDHERERACRPTQYAASGAATQAATPAATTGR